MDRAAGFGGSVTFEVLGDGRVLYASPPRRSVDPALPVSVDVGGLRSLTLRVADGGDGANLDTAAWVTRD